MKILFSLMLCYLSLALYAQDASVISSGGNSTKNSDINISWTLGQPFVNEYKHESIILLEGYQQGETTTPTVLSLDIEDGLKIYPNPTSDYINIDLSKPLQNSEIRIYSTKGTEVIVPKERKENLYQLDLTGLPVGVYQLTIINSNAKSLNSIQIVKK